MDALCGLIVGIERRPENKPVRFNHLTVRPMLLAVDVSPNHWRRHRRT